MRTTLLIVLSLYSTLLSAQNKPFFTADIHAGTSLAHTDIKGKPGVHAGAGVEYRIGSALGLTGFGHLGLLRGSDMESNTPRSFSNQFWQAGALARLYPFSLTTGIEPGMLSELYLQLGVSVTGSNITRLEVPELLMPDNLYRGTDPTLLTGIGYRVYLHEQLKFHLSAAINFPGMDLLDGFAPQTFTNTSKDFFTSISAGITFSLSKGGMPYVVPDIPLLVRKKSDDPERNVTMRNEDPSLPGAKEQVVLPGTPDSISGINKTEENKQAGISDEEPEQKSEPKAELQPDESPGESMVGDVEETVETDTREDITPPTEAIQSDEPIPTVADPNPETPSPERQQLYSDTPPLIGSGQGYPARAYLLDGRPAPDRYYVIGSSLDTQEKAEKLQREMAAKSTEVEILFDRRVNRYRVSFGAFDTYEEALKLANHLRETFDPGTWIIENIR